MQSYRGKRSDTRRDLPSTDSLHKWAQQPGLARLKSGMRTPTGFPTWMTGPSTWSVFCCFPRCASREMIRTEGA